MMQPLWKTIWQFLKMLNTGLPYNPAIPVLGRYSRELKIHVYTTAYTPTSTAALFLRDKKWKQPKLCILKGWILWYMNCISIFFFNSEKGKKPNFFNSKLIFLVGFPYLESHFESPGLLSPLCPHSLQLRPVFWVAWTCHFPPPHPHSRDSWCHHFLPNDFDWSLCIQAWPRPIHSLLLSQREWAF